MAHVWNKLFMCWPKYIKTKIRILVWTAYRVMIIIYARSDFVIESFQISKITGNLCLVFHFIFFNMSGNPHKRLQATQKKSKTCFCKILSLTFIFIEMSAIQMIPGTRLLKGLFSFLKGCIPEPKLNIKKHFVGMKSAKLLREMTHQRCSSTIRISSL